MSGHCCVVVLICANYSPGLEKEGKNWLKRLGNMEEIENFSEKRMDQTINDGAIPLDLQKLNRI